MYIQNSIAILWLIGVALTSIVVAGMAINPVQAETGKGVDVFKVIMTIFDVDESKGDVIAIVTAKDEIARVKLFNATGPEVVPLNASEGGGHLIEYVATFPNVNVNSGDAYKACIVTVKDLDLMCKTGNNSPPSRPEYVDLSLNATRGDVEQVGVDEGDSEEEDVGDEPGETGETGETGEAGETGETGEENNVSPGIPPTG
jgi:hypothetical protein